MYNKIFIYGAPGAGKTSFSILLQQKTGYPLVEADYLREILAQKQKTEIEDTFVYVGTKEAFRHFGELSEENVIKGLKAVRSSMSSYIENEIEKFTDDLILEGSFLDPSRISNAGRLILIVTPDETRHRSQYFEHRERDKNNQETFQATRIIQHYIIEEAKDYNVTLIDNSLSMNDLVRNLFKGENTL